MKIVKKKRVLVEPGDLLQHPTLDDWWFFVVDTEIVGRNNNCLALHGTWLNNGMSYTILIRTPLPVWMKDGKLIVDIYRWFPA